MMTASSLDALAAVTHGFFTRKGGHSDGVYHSLNTGLGADDDREKILRNRDLVRTRLKASQLVTPYQFHSADVHIVNEPWPVDDPPRADALVTNKPGIAIAVNTADCTPVLFADAKAGVIGVAHSGWKGTVGGVLEATIAAMTKLGANPTRITAAIGPTISQAHYEVGPEFHDRFITDDAGSARYFVPSKKPGHFMFDLPRNVEDRLKALRLGEVQNLNACTYADEEKFYSYRRMTHKGEPDYGRQMSAICLRPVG